ncbi:MAG: aspartate aminotransferase [Treponema sp. CETP13]|nr:MAG: aspartate aminotransferase [Treponema sp. CETP13]
MINFTVGPVQSNETVLEIGSRQTPYFRTSEFSEIMLENERLMLEFTKAGKNSRTIFLTGSGTAAMEATVMNVFDKNDKVLVINGGSFGQRFVDLCRIHTLNYTEIKLDFGQELYAKDLKKFEKAGYTGLLVNIHETSTGMHYNMDLLSNFCVRNNIFFVVDAVSSFIADPIDIKNSKIDVMITGSQKALACPPGISVIVLSERAVDKVNLQSVESLYFDLKDALKQAEHGQTPFTPAVSILLQINARLKEIKSNGGIETETNKIIKIAEDFRSKIKDLPFTIFSSSMSNAVTPLAPKNASAHDIFVTLKDEYGIWICPNGGELKDKIFRVGHIGALTKEDNTKLIDALKDMNLRGIL